jgi:hypothetical protein
MGKRPSRRWLILLSRRQTRSTHIIVIIAMLWLREWIRVKVSCMLLFESIQHVILYSYAPLQHNRISVMAELCMKDGGTCRGAGGSMHIYVRSCYTALICCNTVAENYWLLNLSVCIRTRKTDFKEVGHWLPSSCRMLRVRQRVSCSIENSVRNVALALCFSFPLITLQGLTFFLATYSRPSWERPGQWRGN